MPVFLTRTIDGINALRRKLVRDLHANIPLMNETNFYIYHIQHNIQLAKGFLANLKSANSRLAESFGLFLLPHEREVWRPTNPRDPDSNWRSSAAKENDMPQGGANTLFAVTNSQPSCTLPAAPHFSALAPRN